jgi:hypothetical protein
MHRTLRAQTQIDAHYPVQAKLQTLARLLHGAAAERGGEMGETREQCRGGALAKFWPRTRRRTPMSSEPLDRQIVVDHLDRTMMMGTAGNRAEGNEGEHRTSMGWGAWGGD